MQRSPGFLPVPDHSLTTISYEPQNLPKYIFLNFIIMELLLLGITPTGLE
jgi:hypothetical protein